MTWRPDYDSSAAAADILPSMVLRTVSEGDFEVFEDRPVIARARGPDERFEPGLNTILRGIASYPEE